MEKPCLNSPVIGSPLMLTVIMVILVPGISVTHTRTRSEALLRWYKETGKEQLLKVYSGCSIFLFFF